MTQINSWILRDHKNISFRMKRFIRCNVNIQHSTSTQEHKNILTLFKRIGIISDLLHPFSCILE